jgi:L-aminopeptidase/D-esterase-like protein
MAVPLLEIGTRNSASADRACCGLGSTVHSAGIGKAGDPAMALDTGGSQAVVACPHKRGTRQKLPSFLKAALCAMAAARPARSCRRSRRNRG